MQNIKKRLEELSYDTDIDFKSLTNAQITFVLCGALQENFTDEQIFIYADPAFTDGQTRELFSALKSGVDDHKVRLFADTKFSEKQMNKIAQIFEEKGGNKITESMAELFIRKELNPMQIYTIGKGVSAGLTKDDIDMFMDKDLSWEQMSELIVGIKNKTDRKKIKIIADKNFTPQQIKKLVSIAKCLPAEKLSICADSSLIPEQMEEIKNVLLEGKNLKRIDLFKENGVSEQHILQINLGLMNGLSINQIKSYAKPERTKKEMENMRVDIAMESMEKAKHIKCSEENRFEKYGFKIGLSIDKVAVYANMSNEDKKYIILEGIEKGYDVSLYADDRYSSAVMREIKEAMDRGVQNEFIKENITIDMGINEIEKILKNQ